MNKRTDNERLLEEVLAAEADGGFREASLENILRLARHRRRHRIVRRVVGSAVILLVTAIVALRSYHPRQTRPEVAQTNPQLANFEWVVSQPLPIGALVTSRPLAPEQIVSSVENPSIVQTVPGNFREVGDDELIALAAPQVVALVRRGPHEMELIFVTEHTKAQDN